MATTSSVRSAKLGRLGGAAQIGLQLVEGEALALIHEPNLLRPAASPDSEGEAPP